MVCVLGVTLVVIMAMSSAASASEAAPSIESESVTIKSGKATLHGSVNPNGLNTTYQFEWGVTTAYGHSVPIPAEDIGSGEQGVSVEQTIEVEEITLYHYRIAATNKEGTRYGQDKSFTTPDWRPEVTTEAPTDVKSGSQDKSFTTPSAPPPDNTTNDFAILRARARKSGRIVLTFDAPGPGSFTATATATTTATLESSNGPTAKRRANRPSAAERPLGKGKSKRRVAYGTGSAVAGAAGDTTLTIKPRHAALAALRSLGRLPVRIVVTYTPRGATPKTEAKAVTVRR